MAGNHQQSRRMRKFMRKMFPKGNMRMRLDCHSEKRAKENDFFPGDRFVHVHWTAKSYFAADEVRAVLDSFNLVGREIWDLRTSSYDYIHGVEDILGEVGCYVLGEDEDSRKNLAAYVYLSKRVMLERKMQIDEPLVIEFKDGATFEIDIDMDPAYYLSMNRIPEDVSRNTGDGADPSYMFSDVVGKKIKAVDLETKVCDAHPSYGSRLEKPTEIVTAIYLRFENGSRLRITGFYDYLEIASLNRKGAIKKASWESIKNGVVTPADRFFDTRSGFIARGGRLMFGAKGARCAGDHHVVLAPGPGWHHIIPSGREAYIDSDCSAILGLAVESVIPRYWEGGLTIDLSLEEWKMVLEKMDRLVASPRMGCASGSALMRSLYAPQLEQNLMKRKNERVDECELSKWFVEKHKELLQDLKGWTKRALKENEVLRIANL